NRHELYRKRNTFERIHREREFQRERVAFWRDCHFQPELSYRFWVLHPVRKHFEFNPDRYLHAYDNSDQRHSDSFNTSDTGCGGLLDFSFSEQSDCEARFTDVVHGDDHTFGAFRCYGEFQSKRITRTHQRFVQSHLGCRFGELDTDNISKQEGGNRDLSR
ncbi:MAG: hypothetical protein DMG34_05020, partial [Acidobacteria bacterium]